MANRKVEERVEELSRITGSGPEAIAALRKALGDRVNLVTAKAAKVAGQLRLAELIPDLLRAFDRLFEKPVERDPQCWGKNAIARALTELDFRESAPYLRGMRHIQMEPVWGGQEDTAGALRGICVLGLVSCPDLRPESIFRCLIDSLTESSEPAHTVRLEAVRAVAQMGGDDGALLLRLKARAGDREPSVIGQTFDALLAIEREAALDFVADFLKDETGEVRAEAALSLGSCKLPGAIERLRSGFDSARDPDFRDVLLRALSASRDPAAIDFLLEMVKNGRIRDASSAIEALRLHRETPQIWSLVEAAVAEAGTAVQERFRDSPARIGWKRARADGNM